MKININENICDFKLVSSKDVKEINSVCHIFNDNITGAKLLYLENDDSNKVFGIGFRTPLSGWRTGILRRRSGRSMRPL